MNMEETGLLCYNENGSTLYQYSKQIRTT